jgi:predicted N-formylglutamate amidohydrolase
VVDLNRSTGNPALFSRYTRDLPEEEKERLLERLWRPHRRRVEEAIREHVLRGRPVLHLAVHTFTPVLRGRRRSTDIGLLHDPARVAERRFCRSWQADMRRALPGLAVHLNAPYRGTSDGFGMALRPAYRDPLYLAVEIEVNQRFPRRGGPAWTRLKQSLADSLERLIGRGESVPTPRGARRRDPRSPCSAAAGGARRMGL